MAAALDDDRDLRLRAAEAAADTSSHRPPLDFVTAAYRALGATPSPEVLREIANDVSLLIRSTSEHATASTNLWRSGEGVTTRAIIARRIASDPAVHEAILPHFDTTTTVRQVVETVQELLMPHGTTPATTRVTATAIEHLPGDRDLGRQVSAAIEMLLCSPRFATQAGSDHLPRW